MYPRLRMRPLLSRRVTEVGAVTGMFGALGLVRGGHRIAIGARTGTIVDLMISETLWLSGVAAAIGLVAVWAPGQL